MADTQNKSVQYQEALFEAMKIVSQKQVESVSFDKTIEAVVTDASRAEEGVYQVSTGSSQFIAYSTETGYKQNDAVMVTIPQGNFDKQKMIIGKQVDDTDSPLIYKSPFQQFVNISNNLIYGSADLGTFPYYANGDNDTVLGKRWDIDEPDFGKSNACQIIDINTDTRAYGQIWESPPAFFEQGFTRLGLSAQFSTWLDEYDVVSGNYGLALKVTFKCVDLEEDNTFDKYFIFDSSEFFGNVYNFETFYMQEKLFNIEDFIDYPIIHIVLYAYQRGNFKTISGEDLIYEENLPDEDSFDFSIIQPNIFVKSPMVCLGISIEDFESDTAEIFCDNGLTYQKYFTVTNETSTRDDKNKKNLQLRWVHKDSKTDTIATVEEDSLPEGYEIRWYRYSVGAQSPDEFAGAHWQRFYKLDSAANSDTGEWIISDSQQGDDVTNQIRVEFQPNVNRQEEKLKAIILKNEGTDQSPVYRLIAKSNIITFTNNDEVRSQATLIDANALSIRYDDDEKGHYFLYDESGEIGKNEDGEVRILTAVFDERPDGERELDVYRKPVLNIEECSRVVWTFPDKATMNTMVIPMDAAAENANVLNGYTITEKTASVGFTIKKQLNNNATQNRIRLDITKDGRDYSAWVEPVFGTAGDNGSDYKIILTWRDDKNALNLSKDSSGFLEPYNNDSTKTALVGDVVIFDQAGDVVDWPENAELKADWYVAEFGVSSVKQKEKEEEDIYYPVFRNNSEALNQENYFYQLITTEQEFNNIENVYDYNGIAQQKSGWVENKYYKSVNNQENPHSERPYQSAGYYYFVENPQNTGYNYVRFDPDNHTFTSDGIDLATSQLYRKRLNDSEKKNKLEFKKVQFTTEPLNQESGELNSEHGNVEPITVTDLVNEASSRSRYKKNYYYSTNKKYFIKVNDQYILDPWEDYQEVETYYEPIEAKEKVYTLNSVGNTVGGLTAAADNQTVTITANSNVDMNSLFILQLTLKNFGDYDLVSYYPIALKNGETRENIASQGEDPLWQMTRVIQYIEGPDRVRYGSSGETDFKKNPYQISTLQFENGSFIQYRHGFDDHLSIEFKDFNYVLIESSAEFNEIENVYNQDGTPKVKSDWAENTYYKKVGKSHFDPPYDFNGYWQLLFPANSEESNFDPVLKENQGVGSTGENQTTFDKPLLSPSSVYIPDARPYGVQFFDSNHVCLWTQPILVYQNKYPSRTLNKWNGKDIETDNDAGTITASGFAAGRKERDNTFTGVVIGDWSRSKTDTAIAKNTGIYGFNSGAMSYAFKDDGTGFIGKDGSGRIYFDGDKSQIFSSRWVNRDNPQGMLLDIDDGYIKMQSENTDEKTYTLITGDVATRYFTNIQYSLKSNSSTAVYSSTSVNGTYVKLSTTSIPITAADWVSRSSTGADPVQVKTAEFDRDFGEEFNKIRLLANSWVGSIFTAQTSTAAVSATAPYSSNTTYYLGENGTKYITFGSNQRKVPLSIGVDKNIGQRRFRVDWDGTLHVTDGDFSGNISGSKIEGSEVYTTYLEANVGEIGGWTIDRNELSSRSGNTRLISNPRYGQANIITEYVGVEHAGGSSGQLGFIQGSSGGLIGINTKNAGIALEAATASNIRISGDGGAVNQAIYLHAQSIELGKYDGTSNINMTIGKIDNNVRKNYYFQLTASATYILQTNIPATAQFGIYARFA